MNDVPHLKTVSEQSSDIYKLLLNSKPITASDIAGKLDILPSAVYRVVNKLEKLGMIQKIESYPAKFKANNPSTAMNWFLLATAQNFREDFPAENKKLAKKNVPSISFVKDRSHLINRELEDLSRTKKTYNYIVSGHDVPAEVFHENRKAIIRGVKIRKIIHQKGQIKSQYVKDLQQIGVEIRYLPDIDIRMFIFDSQIVYLTSFSSEHNHKAFGIRFAYAPLAMQMDALFEQNWLNSQPI